VDEGEGIDFGHKSFFVGRLLKTTSNECVSDCDLFIQIEDAGAGFQDTERFSLQLIRAVCGGGMRSCRATRLT
jgi:hypothetical protein